MARAGAGFTLLELLLAVAILTAVSVVSYLSFGAVIEAWRRGLALSDDLHHGDYVLEQLEMGLRSAYQPDGKTKTDEYGFELEDNGDDAYGSDVIKWTKLGGALVGNDTPFAGTPHRVEFWVEENERGDRSAAIRAWRLMGQREDFDPDDIEPVYLATRVSGFNCRWANAPKAAGDVEWRSSWTDKKSIPPLLEITLYLEPLDEGRDPIEIKRVVTVPFVRQSGR
ncbi:MAG: prepilin-type N-terminal cleavage/methylation domain-containing protein [Lentisphaerae bacterium]|nr:prepilin-type N-terminal cleavage/methylation domain-containing protein [Lentisphaerota bacterium]